MTKRSERETSINHEVLPDVIRETGVKTPYVSPILVEYGSIAKLTQNGSFVGADGSLMMMTACL